MPYEKVGKNEPVCIADEVPFDIPDSWEWTRLGQVITLLSGTDFKPSEYNDRQCGIPYITGASSLSDSGVIENRWTETPRVIANRGDVLLVCKGSGYGKTVICDIEEAHIARQIMAIKNQHTLNMDYVRFFLQSCFDQIKAKGQGVIPGIDRSSVLSLLFPLPPLHEQKRIVAKLLEVIPIVDVYGTKERTLYEHNAEFPVQLKKSILQCAVQGRLVPQDPNDEPASILLERIRTEKQRLVKEGKIKKDKHESVIFRRDNSHYEKLDGVERCIDDELPFEIPDSWEWVRLGTVLEIARGGSPRPIQQYLTTEPDGINWIKIGDTDKGGKYIYKTKEKIRPEGVKKSRMVHSGDFLLTNSMSFGRPYILKTDGCIHDGWLVLSNRFECYSVDFLYYILSSPFAYYQFCDSVSGAVVKNLNSDKVANALFPLPPLSEQCRIVQRIEKLLPLVKRL